MITDELTDAIYLEPTKQAPEQARRFLSERLTEWDVDDFNGRLIVSELVTNSYVHGAGTIVVRVFRDEQNGLPKVEVWDEGANLPVVRPPNYASISGRGLVMVAALATDWGVRPFPGGGKAVWALLPT
ncbi:ATP-binding protein [Actinomadura algeriensis]|uniref:Anti-sigma regulatory factor (Ser/Thr protein kinase) n=1 Tax=Actinomadura algeriensis TaxID=1679523 RepID=A0ABR9JRP9_9ACTN|nr:ATP-binding protein [Actinomadura algeriensis]MBE1533230.1 anti-sigma regulatory factor (Ser/Thr protein kinase) [Actinomadura algeriensis]